MAAQAAALTVGAAFGVGSTKVKASSATHRALNTYRKLGGDTPKPPKVRGRADPRRRAGRRAGSVGNTPGRGARGAALPRPPKSPTEEDLDDFDLISPLNTPPTGT